MFITSSVLLHLLIVRVCKTVESCLLIQMTLGQSEGKATDTAFSLNGVQGSDMRIGIDHEDALGVILPVIWE